jgi:putative transposase
MHGLFYLNGMKFIPQNVYLVYNQGNNHQQLFYKDEDYRKFLELFSDYVLPYTDVLAWCLIPNHYHFMLSVKNNCVPVKQGNIMLDSVSNGFRNLSSSYAHLFNKSHTGTGSVFRPKTKSKNLNELTGTLSYLNCFYYIHQNAWRHGLVSHASLWKYSSYHFYIGNRKKSICNLELAVQLREFNPETFAKLVDRRIPDEMINSLFDL